MKLFTAKYFSIMLLVCVIAGTINASRFENEDEMFVESSSSTSCCESSCYECGCNPLYCGAWDLQVQGGVNPLLWRQRETISVVNCGAGAGPVTTLFDIPKFRTFYKLPWIVGGQVGYAWADNVRVYAEFNYSQANSKTAPTLVTTNAAIVAPETYVFTLGKYKVFDAYVGTRYYWNRLCDRVAFFVGGKVGFTHHKSVSYALSVILPAPAAVVVPAGTTLFSSNNVVAGGANVGFDVCFCGNWSLVVTGEVVASCGPRVNRNVVIAPAATLAATNLLVGTIGTELRFPVTAGIRYSF